MERGAGIFLCRHDCPLLFTVEYTMVFSSLVQGALAETRFHHTCKLRR